MTKPTRFTEALVSQYRRSGLWTDDTMVSLLGARAREKPHETAVSDARRALSWAELEEEARAVARGLESFGLSPSEPVVVQLPNQAENVVLRYALKMSGLLGVYPPITWRVQEMRQVLEQTGATLLVAPPAFGKLDFRRMSEHLGESFPRLRTMLLASGDDFPKAKGDPGPGFAAPEVSLICVSSGSTGAPKLCESPEAAQLVNGRGLAARLEVTPDDVIGIFAPIDGGAGLMGWLIAVAAGARAVLAEDFGAQSLLDTIARERVSVLATVPALLLRLLDRSDLEQWDLSSLRLVRTGAAALAPSTAREAEARLGAKMVPAAGTMEVLTYAQTSPEDPESLRLGGAVGAPLPGNEARVVDGAGAILSSGEIGVLEVRGAGTGSGYYRDPEATRAAWGELGPNGWFRTGDLAVIEADGNIRLKGRTKDVIRRGGRSVFPAELESLLMEHRDVREVAIVGIRSPALGEKTRAYVVARNGRSLSEAELREFLERKQIATYKIPDEIRLLPELPRLPGAKVHRRALREEA